MTILSRLLVACSFVVLLVPGCGDGGAVPTDDAGSRDSGTDRPDVGAVGDGGLWDAARLDAAPVEDSGLPPSDTGVPETDTGVPESDAATETDAAASDAGTSADACTPPVCPTLPSGCSYIGGTACTCGTVQCVPPVDGCSPRCARTEYCAFADGTCGASGGGSCTATPDFCTDIFDPVCGCDGMTYGNSCDAASNGQNVAFDGECPAAADCRTSGCPDRQTCQPCRGGAYVCLPAGVAC